MKKNIAEWLGVDTEPGQHQGDNLMEGVGAIGLGEAIAASLTSLCEDI